MERRTRTALIGAALTLIVGGTATCLAVAGTQGDANHEDEGLTGAALDQATRAALQHTGGGKVVETEVGDDGAAYGVEIRLSDGRVVEVSLDADFRVVAQEDDDAAEGDDGAGDGDDDGTDGVDDD